MLILGELCINLLLLMMKKPFAIALQDIITGTIWVMKWQAAEDGKFAIEYLNGNMVDVILTDIKMTHVSGLELAEYVNKNRPEVRVVVISGYREFELARKAVEFHVEYYLLKPLKDEEVESTFISLKDRLDKEKGAAESLQKYMEILPELREEFLNDILVGALRKRDEIDKRLARLQLGIDPDNDPCCVVKSATLIINKAMQYISENYSKDISMDDVANSVFLNAAYFSRIFKQLTGDNYIDYLTKFRIDKAIQLLAANRYKINEICNLVGYRNSKYFSRLFKFQTGYSPKEYCLRKLNGGGFIDES